MQEIIGNIFDYELHENVALCIPTNSVIKQDGTAVMGAGLAKIVRDRYNGCDVVLGAIIEKKGAIVKQFWENPNLIAFPTKFDWKDDSSLELIEVSCKGLVDLQIKKNFDKIYLPKVGCGLGSLAWNIVKPILEKYFTEDIYIVVDLS